MVKIDLSHEDWNVVIYILYQKAKSSNRHIELDRIRSEIQKQKRDKDGFDYSLLGYDSIEGY